MGALYRPTRKRKDGSLWTSKTVWARYMFRGKQQFRNTRTDNQAMAKRLLKAWEGNPQLADPRSDRVTINELAEDYLTDYRVNRRRSLGQAQTYVARIIAAFGGRRAASITAVEVKHYILDRDKDGLATATINRDLSALVRMYNLGAETGKITQKPVIKKLKENNVRKGFMGSGAQLALKERMPLWLQVMSEAAYTYGWRKEELQTLLRSQIDFSARQMRLEVGTTKNLEGRMVKLTPALYEMFLKLEMETRAVEAKRGIQIAHVFHRNGVPVKDFSKLWRKIRKDAGVGNLNFHDYRRTAVRNMERARVPRTAAMKITGHRTESTYRRYGIVDQDAMDDATNRIAAFQRVVQGSLEKAVESEEISQNQEDLKKIGTN